MRVVLVAGGVSIAALALGVAIGAYGGSKPDQTVANAPVPPVAAPAPEIPAGATARVSPPPAASQDVTGSITARRAPEWPAAAAPVPAPAPASAAAPARLTAGNCPGNPNALGISRVVEIDTTGGPGFGFEHFKQYDFLRDKEVVLTFDDGPWLGHTPAVLKALADQCVKAVFFPIGKHSTYYPEILREVAAAGHTVGSHTWSHVDLSKKTPEEAKEEIEKGISAVRWALEGVPSAPFFRFPALRHPPEMVSYLGERNIGIWSTDMDSFDFKIHKPEQIIKGVMDKLKKHGKGIVLMHDFQKGTSLALPELLAQLKAGGYKVVQVKAKDPVTSIAQYDELLRKDSKLPTMTSKPLTGVVKTISE